ncbi:MAG: c-type cytochrome [Rhizobiales bacterium]|nr:c-type cytochrome [Hyphomicrobiales bacterium]
MLGLIVFWLVSMPRPLDAAAIPARTPDVANGEKLYNAAGCHSCHKPGPELTSVDAALPAGGTPLKTPIGTLYAPNLTPDKETGLGLWTDLEFVNAVQRGIGKGNRHLIPAFPYTSYAKMKIEDVLDIKAYLATLPAVAAPAKASEIPLPFLLRRGLGAWKWIGLDTTAWVADAAQSESWNRGSYLVNGPGHCQECHTPRTIFMSSDTSKRFAGGPHPEGEGKVPSLLDLVARRARTPRISPAPCSTAR